MFRLPMTLILPTSSGVLLIPTCSPRMGAPKKHLVPLFRLLPYKTAVNRSINDLCATRAFLRYYLLPVPTIRLTLTIRLGRYPLNGGTS